MNALPGLLGVSGAVLLMLFCLLALDHAWPPVLRHPFRDDIPDSWSAL